MNEKIKIIMRSQLTVHGYWPGWEEYQDNVNNVWEYKYNINPRFSLSLLKELMQELKNEGKVTSEPIWKDSSFTLLNGKGWFLK